MEMMSSKIYRYSSELREEIKDKYAKATGGIRLYPGYTIAEISQKKHEQCYSWDKIQKRWAFDIDLVEWESEDNG